MTLSDSNEICWSISGVLGRRRASSLVLVAFLPARIRSFLRRTTFLYTLFACWIVISRDTQIAAFVLANGTRWKKKERKGRNKEGRRKGKNRMGKNRIVHCSRIRLSHLSTCRIRGEGIVAGRNFARFFARDDWWVKAVNGILPVYPRSFVTS